MTTLTSIFKVHKAFGEIVEIAKSINGNVTVCPVNRSDVKVEGGQILVDSKAVARRNWFFNKVK